MYAILMNLLGGADCHGGASVSVYVSVSVDSLYLSLYISLFVPACARVCGHPELGIRSQTGAVVYVYIARACARLWDHLKIGLRN